MSVRVVAVRFDTSDLARAATFWASMLGRDIVQEADAILLPGGDTQLGLRLVGAATRGLVPIACTCT